MMKLIINIVFGCVVPSEAAIAMPKLNRTNIFVFEPLVRSRRLKQSDLKAGTCSPVPWIQMPNG